MLLSQEFVQRFVGGQAQMTCEGQEGDQDRVYIAEIAAISFSGSGSYLLQLDFTERVVELVRGRWEKATKDRPTRVWWLASNEIEDFDWGMVRIRYQTERSRLDLLPPNDPRRFDFTSIGL